MSALLTALLVALGAGAGSAVRYLAGRLADDEDGFPAGTLAVNVAGSAALGWLLAAGPTASAAALLGTGFCGGVTTYSALAVRAVRRGPLGGAVYAAATLVLSLAACAAGHALG